MSLEYIELDDPEYHENVFVRSTEYAETPVTLPKWKPEPCALSWRYQKIGQQIKDMQVQPDDVWLATYPKSGTTWCQEMIWLVCNDLDYERAAAINLTQRFPFMEWAAIRDFPQEVDYLQTTLQMPSPRFIKTHLPVALLPDQLWTVKPRLVYVRRNPKSVAVSYYHHFVAFQGYKATIDEFLEALMKDRIYFSPYHSHVIEYHNLDYQENVLYLCYEDMKQDLKSELKRVCAFFSKTYSDKQLDTLAEHLSFDKMKNNSSVNMSDWTEPLVQQIDRCGKLTDDNYKFIRKGSLDDWKTELTAEQLKQLNEWTKKRVSDPEHLKLFQ